MDGLNCRCGWDNSNGYWIWCSLHKSAPDMLVALKAAIGTGNMCDVEIMIKAAIEKAEADLTKPKGRRG